MEGGEDSERTRPGGSLRAVAYGPGLHHLEGHDEEHEEDAERDERPVANRAAPARVDPRRGLRGARGGGARCAGHARTLRIATMLPNITTPMRIAPWIAVPQLGSTPMNVRSVRTSARTTTAMIGPRTPPRPPRGSPREHDRVPAERVGPWHRCSDTAARQGQAHRGPRSTGQGVATSLLFRPTAIPCGTRERAADDRVEGRPSVETPNGEPDDGRPASTISAFGRHSMTAARDDCHQHGAAPPPGCSG